MVFTAAGIADGGGFSRRNGPLQRDRNEAHVSRGSGAPPREKGISSLRHGSRTFHARYTVFLDLSSPWIAFVISSLRRPLRLVWTVKSRGGLEIYFRNCCPLRYFCSFYFLSFRLVIGDFFILSMRIQLMWYLAGKKDTDNSLFVSRATDTVILKWEAEFFFSIVFIAMVKMRLYFRNTRNILFRQQSTVARCN